MRAIALIDFESGLALREVPTPEPGTKEILVRVRAASINRVDVLIAGGMLRGMMEYEFPVVPGRDFAGVVEQVGSDATRFHVGDEVFGFVTSPTLHDGTWAEYVVVAENGFVAQKPAGLDFLHAAAIPLAAVTAQGAVDALDPHDGDRILIVGADGGVGSFAVQLATGRGASVIATAKPGDEARLRELGAAETIDYTQEDVATILRERYPDGIDGLIDLVNQADGFATLTELVRTGGRAASSLGAADAASDVAGTNVMADSADPAVLANLGRLAETGELTITVDAVYPLAETPAAIEAFMRGKRGKIVLSLESS